MLGGFVILLALNGMDRFMAQLEEGGTNLTALLSSYNVTDAYQLQDKM